MLNCADKLAFPTSLFSFASLRRHSFRRNPDVFGFLAINLSFRVGGEGLGFCVDHYPTAPPRYFFLKVISIQPPNSSRIGFGSPSRHNRPHSDTNHSRMVAFILSGRLVIASRFATPSMPMLARFARYRRGSAMNFFVILPSSLRWRWHRRNDRIICELFCFLAMPLVYTTAGDGAIA